MLLNNSGLIIGCASSWSITHSFIFTRSGAQTFMHIILTWPSKSSSHAICGEKVGHQCCLHSCKIVGHHLVISRLLLSHEETPVDVTDMWNISMFHYCLLSITRCSQQDDSLKLSTSVHSESDSVDDSSALTVKIFFSLQMYEMSEFSSPLLDTEHIHHSYSRRRHNWSKFWISSGRKMGNLWKIIVTL